MNEKRIFKRVWCVCETVNSKYRSKDWHSIIFKNVEDIAQQIFYLFYFQQISNIEIRNKMGNKRSVLRDKIEMGNRVFTYLNIDGKL